MIGSLLHSPLKMKATIALQKFILSLSMMSAVASAAVIPAMMPDRHLIVIGGGTDITDITGDQQKSGVGLVTLPLDRFAGIRSDPELPTVKMKKPPNIGQITLKPLDLAACRKITLNADASSGTVRAELLDADGFRVPGFTKAESSVLHGDSLRHVIEWKGGDLAKLARAPHMLRLHLENATVFAVTLR